VITWSSWSRDQTNLFTQFIFAVFFFIFSVCPAWTKLAKRLSLDPTAQGRIQESVLGGISLPLSPSPFLPPFPSPSPPFPPSRPLPFPSLPSPPLRSRHPVLWLGGLGKCSSSPSGSGQSPAAKRFLVNCRLKIAPVVAMVTKYTSTWSIAKKNAIHYLVRQSQHTIYCAMGPKSFSAVMARKTTSGAKWKTHQKQYISGASGEGGIFQGCRSGSKTKIF